jgi:uncharacterized protein
MLPPMFALIVALFLIGTATSAQAGNPSFDCGRARTPDEKAVCADDRLSELDQAMSIAFNQADPKYRQEARAWARAAIVDRRACADDRVCILDQQVSAIQMYSGFGSQVPVPPWVGNYRLELVKARAGGSIGAGGAGLPTRVGQCSVTRIASSPIDFATS